MTGGYKEPLAPPPVLKRSMFAPHGAQLRPQYEQEDEWNEFLERTDTSKVHDFGRYWWSYGRDKDDDGQLREAVFLEVPLRKDVEARQIRAHLSMRQLKLVVHGDTLLEEDSNAKWCQHVPTRVLRGTRSKNHCNFEACKWLDVGESYWEIEVKEVKKVRRKVLRYVLYVMTECPKYITRWLFECEKKEDDGRYIDQEDEEEDNIDDRLRLIAKMKEPEPYRDADIWFSETEEEEERWCDGCGSTRVVVMKKHTDAKYMKYCNDCPFVSPAKETGLPTGLLKQKEIDEKRARKQRLRARKEEAKRRMEAQKDAKEAADRSEEVPEDYKQEEKTKIYTREDFHEVLTKALKKGEIKWEDY